MKVYSPRVGAKVLLKVENSANGSQNFEKEVLTTRANAWEDLAFDYRGINTGNNYNRIVLIFDNGTPGDGSANFTLTGAVSGSVFKSRGNVNVTTSSGGNNNLPFDDAHTETRVAENGSRSISYTGASATMFTVNTGGSASVFQIGAHYNGNDFYMRTRTDSTTWQTWKKLFHDGYHPNADKWTTARSHTVTLTGQVTGTATQSVDGTGNKTWSISTSMNNSSLDDQYVQILPRHNADGDSLIVTSRASITIWDVSGASDAPSSASDGLVLSAGWDSASWGIQQYHDFHSNDLYLRLIKFILSFDNWI